MNKNVETGGAKDVKRVTSIDFPITYEKTREVVNYLDSKPIISNPATMYKDLISQKQFKDIPYEVVRTIVAIYYEDKGKVVAKKLHSEIKQMFSAIPLNKYGANVKSKKMANKITLKDVKYIYDIIENNSYNKGNGLFIDEDDVEGQVYDYYEDSINYGDYKKILKAFKDKKSAKQIFDEISSGKKMMAGGNTGISVNKEFLDKLDNLLLAENKIDVNVKVFNKLYDTYAQDIADMNDDGSDDFQDETLKHQVFDYLPKIKREAFWKKFWKDKNDISLAVALLVSGNKQLEEQALKIAKNAAKKKKMMAGGNTKKLKGYKLNERITFLQKEVMRLSNMNPKTESVKKRIVELKEKIADLEKNEQMMAGGRTKSATAEFESYVEYLEGDEPTDAEISRFDNIMRSYLGQNFDFNKYISTGGGGSTAGNLITAIRNKKVSLPNIVGKLKSIGAKKMMAGGNIKANIDDKNGLIYLNGAKHEFLIGNDGDVIYDWVNSKNKNEENGRMLVNELITIAGAREKTNQNERAKSIRKLAKFIKENLKPKMMAGGNTEYGKGGGFSSFMSKAKSLGKTGLSKTKEAYGKTKEYAKSKLHDQKKKIALDVIYDAKENLFINREEIKALNKAFRVVEDKYAKGGGVDTFVYTIGGL